MPLKGSDYHTGREEFSKDIFQTLARALSFQFMQSGMFERKTLNTTFRALALDVQLVPKYTQFAFEGQDIKFAQEFAETARMELEDIETTPSRPLSEDKLLEHMSAHIYEEMHVFWKKPRNMLPYNQNLLDYKPFS